MFPLANGVLTLDFPLSSDVSRERTSLLSGALKTAHTCQLAITGRLSILRDTWGSMLPPPSTAGMWNLTSFLPEIATNNVQLISTF